MDLLEHEPQHGGEEEMLYYSVFFSAQEKVRILSRKKNKNKNCSNVLSSIVKVNIANGLEQRRETSAEHPVQEQGL